MESLDKEVSTTRESAELEEENAGLRSKLAASANTRSPRSRLKEQKQEIERIQKKMTLEFENLANRFLGRKAKFAVQNQEVDKLLDPLGERIKNSEKGWRRPIAKGLKDRAALGEQLSNLGAINDVGRSPEPDDGP